MLNSKTILNIRIIERNLPIFMRNINKSHFELDRLDPLFRKLSDV